MIRYALPGHSEVMEESEDEAKGIASLIETFDRPDKAAIRVAVDRLVAITARSPDLREQLHRRLLDPEQKVRWPIAYVLAQVREPSESCIAVLMESLNQRDPDDDQD